MKITSTYRKFIESEYVNRKLSTYEKLCEFFDIFPIPLPRNLKEKYISEINFCHLKITPNGVISVAIFLPLLVFFSLFSIFYILGLISFVMILVFVTLSLILFYYLFTYTSFLTKHFRSKASAEMCMAIIYMSISLKINSNLESAVLFAAQNLTGPLGLDLKKILWDLETGSITSVIDGLNQLSEKWKSENEEFVNAISLLKSAVTKTPDKMDENIREAVWIMIEGTKTRMKKYALAMRSPLRILNSFGLLLPMLVLIFFPILIIFLPEVAKPELIVFSYTVLLPLVIYLFLRQYFFTKPYSYHQVEMKNFESFRKQKRTALILSSILVIVTTSYFIFTFFSSLQVLSINQQFIYSLLFVLSLSFSIMLYSFLSSIGNMQKNKEILQMESELPVVLFQLGTMAKSGKPVEKNIEELLPKIRNLKIKELFEKILFNITSLGMTMESALFEERVGVMNSYPSRIISLAFHLIVDISKRGMYFLSLALKSAAEFLNDANEVDNATEEILSETTSDMQIQAWVFAPLSAGIVVGLMAIIIYIFSFFGQSMQEVNRFFQQTGLGEVGMSVFPFLLNIENQVPFPFFQIIVGIYMLEVVYIIASFLGELNYGDDEVNKLFNLGKLMLIATTVYTVTVCLVYFGMSSILNFTQFRGIK